MQQRLFFSWLGAACFCAASASAQTSEIVRDGSIGPDARVQPRSAPQRGGGERIEIDEALGARPGQGPNLFHSFAKFDLGEGDTAVFSARPDVRTDHIIGRVTGGSPSLLLGKLESRVPDASLFLLNPAGILVGAGAELDLAGSLHLGAADALLFADGSQLSSALGASPPLLSVAPPSSFGFAGPHAGELRIEGASLRLRSGRDLSLVGRNVTVRDSVVRAPGGRIRIASPEGGDVEIDASVLSVSGPVGGSIELSAANLLVQGSRVSASTRGAQRGGGIALAADGSAILRASTLEIHGLTGDTSLVAVELRIEEGSSIEGTNTSAERGGDLSIEADRLHVSEGSSIGLTTAGPGESGRIRITAATLAEISSSDVFTRSEGELAGRSGDFEITAGALAIDAGSGVGTRTLGSGDAGHVRVQAVDLFVGASELGAFARPASTGATGELSIDAERIRLQDESVVGSDANGESGDAGRVRLRAADLLVERSQIASASIGGSSRGLDIQAERLRVSDFGLLGVTSLGGPAGDLRIRADSFDLDGFVIGFSPGELDVDIEARRIDVGRNSIIGVISLDELQGPVTLTLRGDEIRIRGSNVQAGPPMDRSGDLRIDARLLDIDASGVIAGSLTVRADRLALRGDSILGSRRRQPFENPIDPDRVRPTEPLDNLDGIESVDAGDVDVEARAILLDGRSKISSSTFSEARAGNVSVRADSIVARDAASIESRSFGGLGDAGDVTISTRTLELTSGASVATSTNGPGRAGSIRVEASESVVIDGASSPDTLPEFAGASRIASNAAAVDLPALPLTGDAGSIAIRTPSLSLTDGALISSANAGTGRAGSIEIDVERLNVRSGAISTEAVQGPPIGASADGRVRIRAAEPVSLDDGKISASVRNGQGGDVSIAGARPLLLRNGSRILAQTDQGSGGRIQIAASAVLKDGASRISADAGVGQSGTIEIASPERNLAAEIAALSTEYVDASARIRPSCERRTSEPGSLTLAPAASPVAPEELLVGLVEASAQRTSPVHDLDAVRRGADEAPALRLARAAAAGSSEISASALIERGNQQARAGDTDGALASYRESARRADALGMPRESARALANAARVALQARRGAEGRAILAAARERIDALATSPARRVLSINAAKTYADLAAQSGEPRSEALLQAHALLTRAILESEAADDVRLLSYAHGNLGELYRADGRADEALYLVRMAQREAERAAPESTHRWHWREGQLLASKGDEAEAIAAHRRAVALLEESRPEARAQTEGDANFRNRVAPVYLDLADLLLRRAARLERQGADATPLLLDARDTMEKLKAAELRDYFRDECVAELQARTVELDRIASDAAVVYPIALEDRLELLVRLPSSLKRYTVPVPAPELRGLATELRALLQDRLASGYLRSARELYRALVAPYAAELERAGIRTLVFVPDGTLRSVPMAALHDGERFLAQRYALAVAPGLSLVDPRPLQRESTRLLLAGVSDAVQGFEPLPHVRDEVRAIRGLFDGDVLLDGAFSPESIDAAVAKRPFNVLHVASHVVFTGDPATSFVLTHGGRLGMDQLAALVRRTRFREDPLELLVLSACRTAVDDDRAGLGLAGIAIRSGARSAVGSLWSLSDVAAQKLIVEFYAQLRTPELSRAEALRRAQVALMADPQFAHPFYWSPFVLVNNWL